MMNTRVLYRDLLIWLMKAVYAFSITAVLLLVSLSTMPNSYSTVGDRTVTITAPAVSSIEDEPITLIEKGQQVFFSTSITNEGRQSTEFIAILEVRNAQGATLNLQFQKGTVRSFDTSDVGFSWSPGEIQDYVVRAFLISEFSSPTILTPIVETQILVMGSGHLVVDYSVDELQPEIEPEPVPTPISPEEQQNQLSIAELKQYAVDRINDDRNQYGLPPVLLSNNLAAQAHADDMYKTKYHSTHWTSDGMKPYMKYTVYGGAGAVAQNVHGGSYYYEKDIPRCESGMIICEKVNMKEQIEESEYLMMYDDAHADWGHRDNILDKFHTHVSIGIAYDDYYFAFVQNFENHYIEYDNLSEEGDGYIKLSGETHSGTISWIEVYYDELPTIDVYNENRNRDSYDYGEFIADVVQPARPGYYYEQPRDYTLIEAKRWNIDEQSFDIEFNLRSLVNDRNGVYTIIVVLENENYEVYEGAMHSFFES